jgi:hypothetical protein
MGVLVIADEKLRSSMEFTGNLRNWSRYCVFEHWEFIDAHYPTAGLLYWAFAMDKRWRHKTVF